MKALFYKVAGSVAWHAGRGKRTAGDNLGILMLHGVHDEHMAARSLPPGNSTPLEQFTAGMRDLLRRYQIVSLDEGLAMLSGHAPWRPRCVVLTFDDSLKCLMPTVVAWLAGMGLTATFYISTEVINQQRPYWWKRLEHAVRYAAHPSATLHFAGRATCVINATGGTSGLAALKKILKSLPGGDIETAVASVVEQLGITKEGAAVTDPYAEILSWEDVRQMGALGMTVGSHSVSHPNLTLLSPGALREELEQSRFLIEKQTGSACLHFCYPYGAESAEVRQAARAAGYQSAVNTVAPGWNQRGVDLFALRRFAMPAASYRVTPLLAGVAGFHGRS